MERLGLAVILIGWVVLWWSAVRWLTGRWFGIFEVMFVGFCALAVPILIADRNAIDQWGYSETHLFAVYGSLPLAVNSIGLMCWFWCRRAPSKKGG